MTEESPRIQLSCMAHGRDIKLAARSSSSIDSMALTQLVESYIRFYAAGQSHTSKAKRLDIERFLHFLTGYRALKDSSKLKVRDWDLSSVQRFVDDALSRGEAPATVNRRLATIKHMGRTLSERLAGFVNPAREVRPIKVQVNVPKALTRSEIDQIISRARERLSERPSFNRIRNHALFCLLLDTGLRAEEARLLKCAQLDEALEWLASVRTKGRRYRNVYITSALRGLLKDYLEARMRELKRFFPALNRQQDRQLPIFISTYKANVKNPDSFFMGAKTLWRAIRELTVETRLHPHLLRHSFALDLLESSGDIRLVSQALGHSDVKITMRYTERKDREVASALERARRRSGAR